MATNSITNAAALSALIAFARDNGCENTEAITKCEKHLAQLTKPKAKSDLPTKTQRLNASLCEEVNAFLCERGSVTAKAVAEQMGSPYCTTSQKATILLGMLTSQGRAIRHCEKGRVWWTPADQA